MFIDQRALEGVVKFVFVICETQSLDNQKSHFDGWYF